ncbi:hypothetical protein ACTAQI_09390 [Pseudarthrobacter sp. alpha12b]
MVQHRSELSMSRTGIHGGIRRGTAAAAVGAVLVLSTGVQASLADDAAPPPQDPAAQVSADATAAARDIAARQDAPQFQRGSHGEDGGAATDPAAGATLAKTPSVLAVPGALLPAVKASLPTTTPTAAASAAAEASISALPLPDLPLPTVSGTPLLPGGQTATPASPTGTASSPAPTQPRATTASGPTTASAPGAAPAAGTSPEAGATAPSAVMVTPAVGAATEAAPGGADPATGAPAAAGASGTAGGSPRTGAFGGAGAAGNDASHAAANGAAQASSFPAAGIPAAQGDQTRSQPARTPQAAGPPAGPGRAVSSIGPLPDVPDAMVWLGAGLVGVGAAAGLVFLRMRRL